jgi:hypothetical protein
VSSGPRTERLTKRFFVRVESDFIHARTEDEARAEFIQALVEDGSLVYVQDAGDGPFPGDPTYRGES